MVVRNGLSHLGHVWPDGYARRVRKVAVVHVFEPEDALASPRHNCYRPERPLPRETFPHWETAPLRGALSTIPSRPRAASVRQN